MRDDDLSNHALIPVEIADVRAGVMQPQRSCCWQLQHHSNGIGVGSITVIEPVLVLSDHGASLAVAHGQDPLLTELVVSVV